MRASEREAHGPGLLVSTAPPLRAVPGAAVDGQCPLQRGRLDEACDGRGVPPRASSPPTASCAQAHTSARPRRALTTPSFPPQCSWLDLSRLPLSPQRPHLPLYLNTLYFSCTRRDGIVRNTAFHSEGLGPHNSTGTSQDSGLVRTLGTTLEMPPQGWWQVQEPPAAVAPTGHRKWTAEPWPGGRTEKAAGHRPGRGGGPTPPRPKSRMPGLRPLSAQL